MSIIKVRCIIATQTCIPGAEISIVSYSIFLVFRTWAIVCWPFSIFQHNLVIDCCQLTWDTWPDLLISGVTGHKYPDTHNVAPGHGLGEKLVQNVLCFAEIVGFTWQIERDWGAQPGNSDLRHSRPLTEKNTTEEESRIKTEEFLNVTNFHYKWQESSAFCYFGKYVRGNWSKTCFRFLRTTHFQTLKIFTHHQKIVEV